MRNLRLSHLSLIGILFFCANLYAEEYKGSFAKGVYLKDLTYTLRMQYFRSITISKHNPNVAYVASYEGYVFKTTDRGKTWDESRLIVERRPFFGDYGEYLYFGTHRRSGSPSIQSERPVHFRNHRRVQRDRWSTGGASLPGPSAAIGSSSLLSPRKRGIGSKEFIPIPSLGHYGIDPGGSGRAGAAANSNFGIGLPGGAPRLQNFVRKWNKPTAGLNIKQTLYMRGYIPTEVHMVVEHPNDPKIVFACTRNGLFMSYDGGLNWVRTFQGSDWRGRNIYHAAVDPNDDRKVLLATGNGLYISKDGGENYIKATQQGVGGGVINWIFFNPHDSRYVFIGTDYGLLRSSDGGEKFSWVYFTTFPAARVIRYVDIDPFDKKTGYITTYDGIFKTDNILTAGLEDWKRVGGLRFTGIQIKRMALDPTRKGHMWLMTNLTLPSPTFKGWHDTGGAFILESIDHGKTWKVIYSGHSYGSIQWFDLDPKDPSLLWICWSRVLSRMTKEKRDKEEQLSKKQLEKLNQMVYAENMPTVGDLIVAALRYNGVGPKRLFDYRFRSRIRALLPSVQLSYSRAKLNWPMRFSDGLYPDLPYRYLTLANDTYDEWRVMAYWDLSPLVFDLQTEMFGRISRLNAEIRTWMYNTLLRLYSEYRRLKLKMITNPPKSTRVRVFYKLRIEELHAYIDFISGGYLTRYQKGDRPSPWDAPWFERWKNTGSDFKSLDSHKPLKRVGGQP